MSKIANNGHILAAVRSIDAAVGILTYQIKLLKCMKLQDALRGWYVTREEYERLDLARKKLNELLEEMSRVTLPEIMAEENVKTIAVDDLMRRFTINQRVSCSMLDKDAGYIWLRSNGHGGLIQETVNSGTLAAFAKQMAEGGQDLPSEIFKVSLMKYVSATKL